MIFSPSQENTLGCVVLMFVNTNYSEIHTASKNETLHVSFAGS